MPFPRVLVPYEMQSVSSWIWTRVAVFISYDDKYYTTDTMFTNMEQEKGRTVAVGMIIS